MLSYLFPQIWYIRITIISSYCVSNRATKLRKAKTPLKVFSEPINPATFTAADITVSGTTGTITTGPIDTGNMMVFTFSVTGMTDLDTVVVTIPSGGIEDLAGNTNISSTSTDNQVMYEEILIS